jgi:hypothetical protein
VWPENPSSLACGLSCPAFIGNNSRIELLASLSIFVGDQLIRKGEMGDSEEVIMELKETVMFLVKQLVELNGAFSHSAKLLQ